MRNKNEANSIKVPDFPVKIVKKVIKRSQDTTDPSTSSYFYIPKTNSVG